MERYAAPVRDSRMTLTSRVSMKRILLITATGLLLACGQGGRVGSTAATAPRADEPRLLAAAAKRSVAPTQSQIEGESEDRLGGTTTVQNFHLGGFGIGPLQNFPDPINQDLTAPAGAPLHVNAQGVEEHTWIRVMLLSDPANQTSMAFVALDAVGAGNIIQDQLKAAIGAVTGLPADNILFGTTHSHAGADLQGLWGGVPQSWIEALYQAAADAAAEAQAALQPVDMEYIQLETEVFNNYRRPRVFNDIDADTTATILRAVEPASGRTVASLLQYNAHPTSVGTGNDPRVPHPDYILGAVERLEMDGGVALYLNGPIADASGAGGSCEGDDYVRVYCRGSDLASTALAGAAVSLAPSLAVRHSQVILPITNPIFLAAGLLGSFNRYYNFTEIPAQDIPGIGPAFVNLPQLTPVAMSAVSRVTVGETLEIVTIPGEATNTFGEYIQALAGDRPTMLLGLTHNSFGYIIPEEEFSYLNETGETGFTLPFTNYEEYVSMGPLTAPMLRIQGYAPLFDAPPQAFVPPSLAACYGEDNGERCIIDDVLARPDYIQRGLHQRCRENLGDDNAFCALLEPVATGF